MKIILAGRNLQCAVEPAAVQNCIHVCAYRVGRAERRTVYTLYAGSADLGQDLEIRP
jgi:hypothetical protein